MLLTIDVGNSRIKVAVFEDNKELDFYVFEIEKALKNFQNIFEKNSSHFFQKNLVQKSKLFCSNSKNIFWNGTLDNLNSKYFTRILDRELS